MKKQFLFVMVFVLAAIAGVNFTYGQACTEDALHPIAGKPYDYKVSLTGGGTEKSILWFVTTDVNLVSSGSYTSNLVTAGASTYAINSGQGTATINITWAPALIADALLTSGGHNYYVVVKYITTNSEGCDIDNVNAFKILPVNMFQLDLANVLSDGSPKTGNNVCTSTVVSAIITDNGVDPVSIAYNYGVTEIYVKVTATNFTGAWNMTVNRDAVITAAAGSGESAKLYWGLTASGASTEITDDNAVSIAEQNTADATTPEVIYLRLVVTHGTFDGVTPESFNFIVNGTDQAGNPDVDASTCVSSLTDDQVTQTILDRGDIQNNGTTVGDLIKP